VVANAALPEEAAYRVTSAALSAADPSADIHPSAAGTRAENASKNDVLPFHLGAARFYRERGFAVRT
jgi:TRAP-type uncharacterized transport system substrate-binding protein